MHVGGKKELGLNNSNCMLEQNHDFNALLTSYEKYNKTSASFYHNFNKVDSNDDIKIPHKKFTERIKQKIRERYLLTQKYAEATKAFSFNESTVTSIW